MQDNFKHNEDLEVAFLNDSWDKMSAMLDTEMPAAAVSKKDKSYRSFISLLLLLLLTGGGLYWTLIESEDLTKAVSKADSEGTDKLIASYDINDVSKKIDSSKTKNITDGETESLVMAQTKNPTNTITAHNNTLTKIAQQKNNQAEERTTILSTAKNEIAVSANLPKVREEISNIISSEKISTANSVSLAQAATKSKSILLPTNAHPLLEEKEGAETSNLIKPIQTKSKLQFGFIAGLQQEKFNLGFGGFHIGGLVSRDLANSFTLEAGLTFSATQFNKTKADYAPPSITFDQPSEPNLSGIEENLTITYAPSDAEAQDFVQLGTAYWLTLPVQLTYQPLPKWRVNMGVEYAHLLHANQQKLVGNTNDKSGRITDLVAHNNISALTGLTWFPQKNFGVDIRYQFGFTDLFKSNPDFVDQTDTRAALQWSLVYYFNP
ncbi:MAG: porin family protein [Saprospiraceae bacterium]